MDYQTFKPHPDLAPLIKLFWTLKIPSDPHIKKQRVLPDGCVEMIFILGDDIQRCASEKEFIIQPRAFILGQISTPFYVKPTGHVDSFAVRFYPYAFSNFISIPIHKLANTETPLSELFEKKVASKLEADIKSAPSTQERIRIIETFFLNLSKEKRVVDGLVKSLTDAILSTGGSISIKSVLEDTPSKRRQLERMFLKEVGISPKQFSKVVRLQAALKLLLEKSSSSNTRIAYGANYYDQSHFIKDFKEFTGVSPTEFFDNDELSLSSVLYEGD